VRNSAFRRSALNISATALSASLICICSWIALPIGGVPMTLQTFGVAFCGFLLGVRGGICAAALYLALGAVGLPVFAGFGGSLAFLVGPTGGFLIGFPILALCCGFGARRKRMILGLVTAFPGLIVCHLMGVLWFAHVSAVSPVQAFLISSLPYLAKDILCILIARAAAKKVEKAGSFFGNR
jgi:biotin transport system substrate-specific component